MTMTPDLSARPVASPAANPIPGALVAGVAGPLLLAVGNALVNFGPIWSDVETTADIVRATGENQAFAEFSTVVGVLAVALLVPAVWAVTAVLRPRTPTLAAIGGWMMATGYVMALVLSTESATALLVAKTGLDPATYVTAVDDQSAISMLLIYALFGVGALAGGLILGIAMLRQGGAIPAWAGWALIASAPVRVVGLVAGIPFGPPLASMLIAAAFTGTLMAARSRKG